jgi:hypothetical protein
MTVRKTYANSKHWWRSVRRTKLLWDMDRTRVALNEWTVPCIYLVCHHRGIIFSKGSHLTEERKKNDTQSRSKGFVVDRVVIIQKKRGKVGKVSGIFLPVYLIVKTWVCRLYNTCLRILVSLQQLCLLHDFPTLFESFMELKDCARLGWHRKEKNWFTQQE